VDAARQYITDVMARLEALTGVSYPFGVSELVANEQHAPPRIDWWYGRIRHVEPTTGNIYTELQDLEVRVWHTGDDLDAAETNTRTLKNNLLAAAREIAIKSYTGALEVGDFDWSEERHTNHGRWLQGTLTIPLPVPPRVQGYLRITQVGTKGTAVLSTDETVCNDNFDD
jgi:hypothetical protein